MSRLAFDENNYRDHAIDYLDDLMAADERAAFEGSLAKNPAWSKYVEDLRSTWRRARIVINEGAQAAPSRVRIHVLAESAKRAAILREERNVKLSVPDAAPGLWAWVKQTLLARPWFAPAFVATAAVGLYVFSQQSFKDARPSAVTVEAVKQEAFALQDQGSAAQSAAPLAAAPKMLTEPVPVVEGKVAVGRSKQKEASTNRKRDLPVGGAGLGGLAAPSKKGFAQPPAEWSAGSADKASQAAPEPQAALAESEESMAAPASAPSAPMPIRAASSAGAERDSESSDDSVQPSITELITKAQNAERDEQWAVAVQSYRQLLRRFPADKNAAIWKQRMTAAAARIR